MSEKNENRLEILTKEIEDLTIIYKELVSVKYSPTKKESFFARLFKNKNKVNLLEERTKQIEEKYVFLDDYITILRLGLRYYFGLIKAVTDEIGKQSKMPFPKLVITENSLTLEDKVHGFIYSVSLEGEPTFVKGNEILFNKIKPSLYKLVFYLQGFKNFCNQVPKEFFISENTKIKTTIDEIEISNDINVIVEFGDMGFLDFNMQQERHLPNISFYSNNYEISKYLNSVKDKLYHSIHIEREKISKLLELYHEIFPNK